MIRDLLSHALKQLRRDSRVSVFIIVSVAIASTAASVLFAAVGSLLTVRIPGVEVDTLVEAFETYQGVRYAWSLPFVADLTRSAKLANYAGTSFFPKTIDTPAGPVGIKFETVTTNYSDVLGQRPAVGRWFRADENQTPMRDAVVVLSEELCVRDFGGAESCLNQHVHVGTMVLSVIGVMPTPFRGAHGDTDAWVPIMLAPLGIGRADEPFPFWTLPAAHWMALLGRVRSPGDVPKARREMKDLYAEFTRTQRSVPDAGSIREPASPELLTIRASRIDPIVVRAGHSVDAAIAMLLLMTCANAALLLIARTHAKSRRIAIQLALGATGRRILAGLLVESLVLGAAAAALGWLLTIASTGVISSLTRDLPELQMSGMVLSVRAWRAGLSASALTIGAEAIVLLVIAMLAAWRITCRELMSGAAMTARLPGALRVRTWHGCILAFQVASAIVLAISAALLTLSYRQTISVPLGFAIDHVLTIGVSQSSLSEADESSIVRAAAAAGGVRAAGRIECLPLSRACLSRAVTASGEAAEGGRSILAVVNHVDAAALDILQIHTREGRGLSSDDGRTDVAVVSRAVSGRLAAGRSIIGQSLQVGGIGRVLVVGVVDDIKYDGLTELPKAAIYIPWRRADAIPLAMVVETSGSPSSAAGSVRAQLAHYRPDLATAHVTPLSAVFRELSMEQRLQTGLLVAFAVLATTICVSGILGVTSFTVNLGLPEIGIRLALGSPAVSAIALVVSRLGRFIVTGVACGLAISVATGRFWTPLLYRVDPTDPRVIGGAATIITFLAIGSVLWVALRAVSVNPAISLRSE